MNQKMNRGALWAAVVCFTASPMLLPASVEAKARRSSPKKSTAAKTETAPRAVGRVTASFGTATVKAVGSEQVKPLEVQGLVHNNDRIETEGGGLSLLLASRVVLKIDPDSAVRIIEGNGQSTIVLERGTVHTYIGKRPATAGMVVVQDPNARIEGVESVFLASYDPSTRKGYYACEHAAITLQPSSDRDQELTLNANEQMILEKGALLAQGALDRVAFLEHKESMGRLAESGRAQSSETFRVRIQQADSQAALSQLVAFQLLDSEAVALSRQGGTAGATPQNPTGTPPPEKTVEPSTPSSPSAPGEPAPTAPETTPEPTTPEPTTPVSESPVAETPEVQPPVTETPIDEPPPVETPIEPPVAEEPVIEPPVVEVPVEEPPIVEPPVVEVPVDEPPVVEVPVEEPPIIEPPVVEVPVDEPPVVEVPVEEPPIVEPPVVEVPVDEPPVVEVPIEEPPIVEPPVVEVPIDEPVVEVPIDDPPVIEPPVAEVPIVEEPVIEAPVEEVPIVEPPVVEPPVTEIPVDEPVVETPTEVLETPLPEVEAPIEAIPENVSTETVGIEETISEEVLETAETAAAAIEDTVEDVVETVNEVTAEVDAPAEAVGSTD